MVRFLVELCELGVPFEKIKPLLVALLANIFPKSIGCLLFMVSSVEQKLVSLIRPHLYSFAFIAIFLGD